MKPLGRKNYGSIPHLSNSRLGPGDNFIGFGEERILTEKTRDKHDEVFVFEKYDGSNVGVGKKNGKIFALTRSGYEAKTSPYEQHHVFSDWVDDNYSLFDSFLYEGCRITGELMVKPHGIRYDIDSRLDPVVFFDYFNDNNDRMCFDYLHKLHDRYSIQLPRLIHRGLSASVDSLKTELNKKTYGITPDENPEGMVYRVERKGKVDFLAKWVREDFISGKYLKL